MNKKKIFLTGASSGLGAAMAKKFLDQGHLVWATSRSLERLPVRENLYPLVLDLASPPSIDSAWNEAIRQAGHFDVVVQNGGSGWSGSIEEVSLADAEHLWKILVLGPLQLLGLAAGHLRSRGEGLIIGVSSLAAEMPMAFSAHYSAGKAAFSSLLSGLWMELKPFGVQVVDLRPGDISTAFNQKLLRTMPPESPYLPWARKAAEVDDQNMRDAPSAQIIAQAVALLIESPGRHSVVVRRGSFIQACLAAHVFAFLPRKTVLNIIRTFYGLHSVDALAVKKS